MKKYLEGSSRVLELLKSDMYDDWFPDPLDYSDILSHEKMERLLETYNHESIKSELFNVPKPAFMLRYSLEQRIHERFVYHAIASRIIEFTDSLLPDSVYGFRFDKNGKRRLFYPPTKQWKKWERAVREVFHVQKGFLLTLDISNFYEFIRVEDVVRILHNHNSSNGWGIEREINDLENLLRGWSWYKGLGIPQNRDPSSHIANIYLLELDKLMEQQDVYYFRYMDDIKVVCKSHYEARRILKLMIEKLRSLGLALNSKKTEIIDYHNEVERKEALPDIDYTLESIEELINSKGPIKKREGAKKIEEILLGEFERGDFASRKVKFCCNRMHKLLRFGIEASDNELVVTKIIEAIANFPWMATNFYKVLISSHLTDKHIASIVDNLNAEENILYGYKMFYLWRLAYLKIPDDKLILKTAHKRFDDLSTTGIEKGSMSLYFESCDDYNGIKKSAFQMIEGEGSSYLARSSVLLSSRLTSKDRRNFGNELQSSYLKEIFELSKPDEILKGDLILPLKELDEDEMTFELEIENDY